MKGKKKIGAILLTAAMVVSNSGLTAMAASKEKISSVRLNITDRLSRGAAIDDADLEIESASDKYDITDWEFDNEGFIWEESDVPRVKVTLETDEDSKFSVTKEKVKIKGSEAKVVSTKKENSQTLIVTLDLQPMSERVSAIEYAYLNGTTAVWGSAEGAVSYELYLYRDGKAVGSKRVTVEPTYDFGTAMLKDGSYHYRVRAVGKEGGKEGRFIESEEYYKNGAVAVGGVQNNLLQNGQEQSGQWLQDTNGWQWLRADNTRPVNTWELINGKWYYFYETGYMAAGGWLCLNGLYYYVGPEGDMLVNCQTPDGYWVNELGVRIQ